MSVESPESDGTYQNFQNRVRRRMAEQPFNHLMPKDEKVFELTVDLVLYLIPKKKLKFFLFSYYV